MKKSLLFISIALMLALLFACQTTSGTNTGTTTATTSTYTPPPFFNAKEKDIFSGTLSDFAKQSLPSFETYVLDNGIPVIIKKNPSNQVFHIRLALLGGSSLSTTDTAGIEKAMLMTMARGSKSYKYEDISAKLDAMSSTINTEVLFDCSAYSLNTLDKYFADLFPIWLDTIVNPSFTDSDFNKVNQNMVVYLSNRKQSVDAFNADAINREFFKNSVYAPSPDGNDQSLKTMNVGQVKDYYAKMFSANRMVIIAVGNFKTDDLKKQLNAALGKIQNTNVAIPGYTPFIGKVDAKLLKNVFPQSKTTFALRGDIAAPTADSPDFMPFNIAFNMLNNLLFQIVRAKYSACYTPYSAARTYLNNYASIVINRGGIPDKIKAYIDEAIAPLMKGLCFKANPEVQGDFEAIETALPIYAEQYIAKTYDSQQTNSAVAALIQNSIITYKDFRYYLIDTTRVKMVTPADIKAVLKKYLFDAKILWSAAGAQSLLDKINDADYTTFLAPAQ